MTPVKGSPSPSTSHFLINTTNGHSSTSVTSDEQESRLSSWQDQCRFVRLVRPEQRPAFEMLVVGCGGGPLETNLSSYLVKPYSTEWKEGCTSLEGGSTIGALANLIEKKPYSFAGFGLKIGVDLNEQPSTSTSRTNEDEPPSKKFRRSSSAFPSKPDRKIGVGREGGGKAAGKIWDMVRCFAISHAHLDHIQGVIISSGASASPRPLYGTSRTLANLDNIFDGGVWPRLVGWESDGKTVGRAYLYREVPTPLGDWSPLSPSLSFEAMPISHGMDPSFFHPPKPKAVPISPPPAGSPHTHPAECYDSTAFFIRESVTGEEREFLFFGDVEPDSISKRPMNLAVWRIAAPRIVSGKLATIFLECSYPTSQPIDKLWGHLSPQFVLEELLVLKSQVVEARQAEGWSREDAQVEPLKGVTVIIIHIKDDILSFPTPSSSRHPTPPPVQKSSPSKANSAQSPPRSDSKPLPSNRSIITGSHLHSATHSPLTMSPPLPALPLYHHRNSVVGLSSLPSTFGTYSIRKGGTFTPLGANDFSNLGPRRASLPAMMGSSLVRRKWSGASGLGEMPSPIELPEGMKEYTIESTEEEGEDDDTFDEEDDLGEPVEETVHERIERELNELEEEAKTGVRFLRAEQGMRIGQFQTR